MNIPDRGSLADQARAAIPVLLEVDPAMPKLYLLINTVDIVGTDYKTESAVVVAASEAEAKLINPAWTIWAKLGGWADTKTWPTADDNPRGWPRTPDEVSVKYLGIAAPEFKLGDVVHVAEYTA